MIFTYGNNKQFDFFGFGEDWAGGAASSSVGILFGSGPTLHMTLGLGL